MNIVKELRKKKGVQQKELAITIGVSQPTVSEWEANKKDPSGDRLRKLAEFFGVDELVVLGKKVIDLTEGNSHEPKTIEAKIISGGIDKMPEAERERALSMMRLMFAEYADYFEMREKEDSDASDS